MNDFEKVEFGIINSRNYLTDSPVSHIAKMDEKQKEALAAAYALNMCTVSVSQIIQYNDAIIMEQEYDSILNNLNLQKMPKKNAALLELFEQLLDTITYFRIDKMKREEIDRDYQFKMKNALWDSVPNFGLIVAGGSLKNMLISLVSQVGIGYMNYRKTKAQNTLEYQKMLTRLEISLVEQLHGLRRQLFDSAWKLSETYEFNDEYRLTEKQIEEYNETLMDNDPLRKYERMNEIKEKFIAYPPFWYHFGHAAVQVAIKYNENELVSKEFSELAKKHFEEYDQCNIHDLLRDDPITCSCALEYIELLDEEKDREKIRELIERTLKYCGGEKDILQLLAFACLKIEDVEGASNLIRRLVNSGYNANMNGQLLSRIYVQNYIAAEQNEQNMIRADYYLLCERVNPAYLIPLPKDGRDEKQLMLEFEYIQKRILKQKYIFALEEYFENKVIAFNTLIPVYSNENLPNNIWGSSEDACNMRIRLASDALSDASSNDQGSSYADEIANSEFWRKQIVFLDNMVSELDELDCIRNMEEKAELISRNISRNKPKLEGIKKRLFNEVEEGFSLEDYKELQKLDLYTYTREFGEEIIKEILAYIEGLPYIEYDNHIITLMDAEADLRKFCKSSNIEEPDILFDKPKENEEKEILHFFAKEYFDSTSDKRDKQNSLIRELTVIADKKKTSITKVGKRSRTKMYTRNDAEFKYYFEKKCIRSPELKKSVVVILDDTSRKDIDLLITTEGLIPVRCGKIVKSRIISYSAFCEDVSRIYGKPYYLLNKDQRQSEIINAIVSVGVMAAAAAKKECFDYNDINQEGLLLLIAEFAEITADRKFNFASIDSKTQIHSFSLQFENLLHKELTKDLDPSFALPKEKLLESEEYDEEYNVEEYNEDNFFGFAEEYLERYSENMENV